MLFVRLRTWQTATLCSCFKLKLNQLKLLSFNIQLKKEGVSKVQPGILKPRNRCFWWWAWQQQSILTHFVSKPFYPADYIAFCVLNMEAVFDTLHLHRFPLTLPLLPVIHLLFIFCAVSSFPLVTQTQATSFTVPKITWTHTKVPFHLPTLRWYGLIDSLKQDFQWVKQFPFLSQLVGGFDSSVALWALIF